MSRGCFVFDTTLGYVGIAWTKAGLCRLVLPERSREAVRTRLAKAAPGFDYAEPSGSIAGLVGQIRSYADGNPENFSAIRLDLDGR